MRNSGIQMFSLLQIAEEEKDKGVSSEFFNLDSHKIYGYSKRQDQIFDIEFKKINY